MFMVRIVVYINNKSKADGRFTFSDAVRLTESYPPLSKLILIRVRRNHKDGKALPQNTTVFIGSDLRPLD